MIHTSMLHNVHVIDVIKYNVTFYTAGNRCFLYLQIVSKRFSFSYSRIFSSYITCKYNLVCCSIYVNPSNLSNWVCASENVLNFRHFTEKSYLFEITLFSKFFLNWVMPILLPILHVVIYVNPSNFSNWVSASENVLNFDIFPKLGYANISCLEIHVVSLFIYFF